jgi:hypothetical protein
MNSSAHEIRFAVGKLRGGALAAGLAGSAACAVGFTYHPQQFYAAYLVAYVFWLGVSLGSLAIALLHHLTGGGWGVVIRRPLEAAYGTLPLMVVLFLPVVLGIDALYPWARPEVVAHDALLQGKASYLNVEFFQIRAVVYFVLWILLGLVTNRITSGVDPAEEPRRQRWLALISGPGLILWCLSVTFAAIDWVMSLEPHWFSSMYGVLYMGGFAVSGMALALFTVCKLAGCPPWDESLTPQRLNDLGNLQLAFTVFWTYISFMQYLIIWTGNLPEESIWYARRTTGGWDFIAVLLICLHFALPFLFLLSRENKRDPARLMKVALLLLAMRLVDLFWLVQPALSEKLTLSWLHLAAVIAIGGWWLALYAWRLPARAALPVYELPEESFHGPAAYPTHGPA